MTLTAKPNKALTPEPKQGFGLQPQQGSALDPAGISTRPSRYQHLIRQVLAPDKARLGGEPSNTVMVL